MFGHSFSEILLITIPLVFLWISMKRDRGDDARRAAPPPPLFEAEDMMACAVCGVYRPTKFLDPCERDDYPFLKSG